MAIIRIAMLNFDLLISPNIIKSKPRAHPMQPKIEVIKNGLII